MADYGYVVGTFIHPLAGQDPVDRPQGGRVTFFPDSVQHLPAPPRTVGPNPEAMVMGPTGKVAGWLAAGIYNVQVTFRDGVQLPSFYVHVLDTHTEAAPLDLTTAAPPAPGPNTVVVVSEAERVLAEQAAAAAAASASDAAAFAAEVAPVHVRQVTDLLSVTKSGPAIFHYDPNLTYDPPLPSAMQSTFPYEILGEVAVYDLSSLITGVIRVNATFTVSTSLTQLQMLTGAAYKNYPSVPPTWDFVSVDGLPASTQGAMLLGTSLGWSSTPLRLGMWVTKPTSAIAPGNAGEIAYDGAYLYVCLSANNWGRMAANWNISTLVAAMTNTATGGSAMARDANGRAQVATPSAAADIATKGYVDGLAAWVAVPASATAAGTAGQRAYDANYLYVCVATNTWKRTALATW